MRTMTRGRRFLFTILAVLLIPVLLEFTLHLAYVILKQRIYPTSQTDETLKDLAQTNQDSANSPVVKSRYKHEVIHPYLGFVYDPVKSRNISYLGFFPSWDDPLVAGPPGTVTVAIFGGSFALGLYTNTKSELESNLRERGINARILTLGLGGYKQPQQLFTLAYLLSHGAKIDVVVNVDGFNEVALPQSEILPKNVNPFYPRGWNFRTTQMADQETLRRIGKAEVLRESQTRWARTCSHFPKYSILRNMIWRLYDNVLEHRLLELRRQALEEEEESLDSRPFLSHGPDFGEPSEAEHYRQAADHWKSCSLLMQSLCSSQGITYLHFLQPNQYLEGTKVLTEDELTIGYREGHTYQPGVVLGYPKLLEAGKDLLKEGVDFHDLTMIYRDRPQSIYKDTCCHPNKEGYEIVADYIAESIATALSQAQDQAP